MKNSLTKIFMGLVCLVGFANANDNIQRSLATATLSKPKVDYAVSKDMMRDLQRKAIVNVGKSLDIDTSMFDKKRKFSLYIRVSSTSKFGFRYKF